MTLVRHDEQLVLDIRPIELPGFTLRARSAIVVGKPKLDHWVQAMRFATAVNDAAPYWIGDLLTHAEGRDDWREKMDQAIAATGLAKQTLENYQYIARHVEEPERVIAPSPAHAAEVAKLDRPDQTKYLDKAKTEGWTRNELRRRIRADQRTRIIDGQAVLEGMFRVIYADPSWKYSSAGGATSGAFRTAEETYPTMAIEEICRLPVEAHALPDCTLFMWSTVPFLLQNPGPREVLDAWGFTYKTNRVWDKVLGNPGSYGMQVTHEHLIIATRGNGMPTEPLPHDDSVLTIRRSPEHSEKPEEAREFITRHWTRGPYLELFGRKRVEGWTVFGNDARLWAEEAATNGPEQDAAERADSAVLPL